jgi:hypothetical protein
MKRNELCIVVVLAASACGGNTVAPVAGTGSGKVATATPPVPEIKRRQLAACEALGPKITECAIADAKASMTPEKFADLKVAVTGPKNTEEFIKACGAEGYSSRQVRVLEVCFQEESQCAPLLACLQNLAPAQP